MKAAIYLLFCTGILFFVFGCDSAMDSGTVISVEPNLISPEGSSPLIIGESFRLHAEIKSVGQHIEEMVVSLTYEPEEPDSAYIYIVVENPQRLDELVLDRQLVVPDHAKPSVAVGKPCQVVMSYKYSANVGSGTVTRAIELIEAGNS